MRTPSGSRSRSATSSRRVEQRDLDAVDLVGVRLDDVEHDVRRVLEIGRSPVSGERRVEHVAEPVQDHRARSPARAARRRPPVVVGAVRRGGQRAAGHQDHRRALALDERELLVVGAADVVERRRAGQLVGAGAAGELAADGLGLGHRAADQLLRRRPVQAHPALRGVHRLGHAQAVRPQVAAEVQRRLPVQLRRTGRVAAGQRVGDDVRGGVSTRACAARAPVDGQRLALRRLVGLQRAVRRAGA